MKSRFNVHTNELEYFAPPYYFPFRYVFYCAEGKKLIVRCLSKGDALEIAGEYPLDNPGNKRKNYYVLPKGNSYYVRIGYNDNRGEWGDSGYIDVIVQDGEATIVLVSPPEQYDCDCNEYWDDFWPPFDVVPPDDDI